MHIMVLALPKLKIYSERKFDFKLNIMGMLTFFWAIKSKRKKFLTIVFVL